MLKGIYAELKPEAVSESLPLFDFHAINNGISSPFIDQAVVEVMPFGEQYE